MRRKELLGCYIFNFFSLIDLSLSEHVDEGKRNKKLY